MQVNSTLCNQWDIPGAFSQLCGLEHGGNNAFLGSLPEGLRTLSNSSAQNAVAFADDQTALVVLSVRLFPCMFRPNPCFFQFFRSLRRFRPTRPT